MRNPLQGTPEWYLAHRGKISSSRAHTVVYGGPRGWLSLMEAMRAELESTEPLIKELYTDPIIRGREYESAALAAAETILLEDFEQVGYIDHPFIEYLGCSSDALARDRTVNVEAKVYSKREKHLEVYNTQQMPRDHIAQVQHQMLVHNCDLTLFISYFPEMPHWKMQTVILEVKRDQAYIDRALECYDRFIKAFRGEQPLTQQVSVNTIPKLF